MTDFETSCGNALVGGATGASVGGSVGAIGGLAHFRFGCYHWRCHWLCSRIFLRLVRSLLGLFVCFY